MTNLPIPDAVLDQHLIALGKTGAGKSSALRLLAEHILDQEKPICIIDPKGDWWGLKSSADGKSKGYSVVIFGGAHADVPITPQAGAALAELVATGNRPCIIDLKSWTIGERTRFFIDFASTLFRVTKGKRFLLIDECHNFAPQGKVWDADSGKMIHWANRLASEGRGLGITLLSASQRPQKVHKDYLTCHETLLAMRVTHPLDRAASKDWMDGTEDRATASRILGELAGMKRGEGWVWSPEIGFGPTRITFPMFWTYDSFKPAEADAPDHLEGWAAVDLGEVSERMQTIIDTARASDPAVLKRRIAELEHQMTSENMLHSPVPEAVLQERYNKGLVDGQARILAKLRPLAKDLMLVDQFLQKLGVAAHAIENLCQAPIDGGVVADPAITITAATVRPQRITSQRAVPINASGQSMSKAERKALTVLAQYGGTATKKKVALLTGYAIGGGGFNNALGALRTKGWINGSDPLELTSAGLAALGPYEPVPSGQDRLNHWIGQLGKAESAILMALASAWPKSLSKDQIATETGYEPTGGGFNNALGRLRTLELITRGNHIKASEELFA
jgi:hypothetical protein